MPVALSVASLRWGSSPNSSQSSRGWAAAGCATGIAVDDVVGVEVGGVAAASLALSAGALPPHAAITTHANEAVCVMARARMQRLC
jgi:hypothetical protein